MKYINYVALLFLLSLGLSIVEAQELNQFCIFQSLEDGGGTLGCYNNQAEAIRVATSGVIDLPDTATRAEIDSALRLQQPTSITGQAQTQGSIVPFSSTVIGILYEDTNYGGSGAILTVSEPNGCIGGQGYGYDLTNNWDNRVESARGYQGCIWTHAYDFDDFTGPNYKCANDCSTFFALNNNIESVIVQS